VHSYPDVHPLVPTKAHGLQCPVKCPAEPMVGNCDGVNTYGSEPVAYVMCVCENIVAEMLSVENCADSELGSSCIGFEVPTVSAVLHSEPSS